MKKKISKAGFSFFFVIMMMAGCLIISTPCLAIPGDPTLPEDTNTVTEEKPAAFERIDQDGLRNPFWPIGYSPSPEEVIQSNDPQPVKRVNVEPQWNEAMKKLDINGIMKLGSEYVATINGQVAKEGDIVALLYEGNRYRWRVRSISQGGKIRFKPVDVMAPTDEDTSLDIQPFPEENPDANMNAANPMFPFGK